MTESGADERYAFIKNELQSIIEETMPNEKMTNWRKKYRNHNEWTKVVIAGKVGQFFRGFKNCALSMVNTEHNPGNQPMSWFERFGWRTYTVQHMRRTVDLSIEELCMYIEHEMEYEDIFLSARESRYIRREKLKEGLASGEFEY